MKKLNKTDIVEVGNQSRVDFPYKMGGKKLSPISGKLL